MKRSILLTSCAMAGAAVLAAAGPGWSAEDTLKAATVTANPSQIETDKLIGQTVKNTAGQTIGKIDSVLLNKDGKAIAAIVGVGGFLGMGEHEVAIGWDALRIADAGRSVQVNFTKDQLRAMPEYKFTKANQKSTAFYDEGYRTAQYTSSAYNGGASNMAMPAEFSASKLAGVDIVNAAGEKIGDISDVVIASSGRPRIVMSVGGFLGMGEHRVAVDWGVIALSRDQTGKIHARLDMTKEQLEATPEYRSDPAAR